jgi:hypothetical protein
VLVGTSSYENPNDAKDTIEIMICRQAVHFDKAKISESFENGDKINLEAL